MNQEVKAETDNRKKRAGRRGRREGGRKEGKKRKGSVVRVGVGVGGGRVSLRRISAESSLMSLRRPSRLRDLTRLNR